MRVGDLAPRARALKRRSATVARGRLDRFSATWHEVQPLESIRDLAGRLLRVHDLRSTDALQLGAAMAASGIEYGLMHVLMSSPDDVITPDRIDVSLRGSIVLAGHCNNIEVLKTASELPLRGLIFASIDIAILAAAARIRIPIVVIEGFGKLPMNSAAYKLLTTHEQREVTVNAEQWLPFSGSRPEAFIALPAPGELPQPPETVEFAEGQQVHIVRAPYTGKIGIIVELRPGTTILPNGLATQAALVQIEGIMRRILRKISENRIDELGDTSTLADPSVVTQLVSDRL